MKKITALVMTFVLAISLVGCKENQSSSDESGNKSGTDAPATVKDNNTTEKPYEFTIPPDTTEAPDIIPPFEEKKFDKGFTVKGNQLLDANGNEFVMRGINHSHTWFQDKLKTAIPAMANTGANTVRIVLSSGIQWKKESLSDVKDIIKRTKAYKMVAVLEMHDATGRDDPKEIEQIVDHWISLKDALIGNEAYVILNIANEWPGKSDGKLWSEAYLKAIPKLRAAGIKNTILVDAAGWGQYADSVAKYGKEVFESDPDKNTMFAVHMYGTAGPYPRKIRDNLKNITDQGLCVIVGEFGFTHSDGDVDEAFIMQYTTENKIGYLAWSWKGNGGGVEYLDMVEDWEGTKLTKDWGEVVVNGKNGIKETSKICSVFE